MKVLAVSEDLLHISLNQGSERMFSKRIFVLVSMLCTVMALVACKTQVSTEVSAKDLFESASKSIPGEILVPVLACNDYKEKEKESSSLIQVKKQIPEIFSEAKYEACLKEGSNSFAKFSLPIGLDKDNDGKFFLENSLNIISYGSHFVSLGIPDAIRKSVNDKKSSNAEFSLDVRIKVKNDTGKKFSYNVFSAYIDTQPQVYATLQAKANATFEVKLSDVSVDEALKNSITQVLTR